MRRHRFDPPALVLGALAVAAGVLVLAVRSLAADADVLLSAGLIGLGVALLTRLAGPGRDSPVPPAPEAEAGAPAPRDSEPT